MTAAEKALSQLEDAVSVWERWALEPEEKDGIRHALDALEVLRKEFVKPAGRVL